MIIAGMLACSLAAGMTLVEEPDGFMTEYNSNTLLASSPDLGPVARFTTRSPLVRDSQSRAGTKPPLQVKCLRRFTIWRGGFYRRAPQVKNFLRASRASRALQFYIVSFSFSTTLYLRQCPLGSTLPPYFFLL